MSACPDAERLAEYAEGGLDAKDRAEIEAHLADCADCRAVLYETRAFIGEEPSRAGSATRATVAPFRPRARRRWPLVVAALAAAAGVVVALRVAPPRWIGSLLGTHDVQAELQMLAAALQEERTRPIEGRLAGGFGYAPLASTTRGPGDQPLSAGVREAAARVEKAAADDARADAQAALGAALLIEGRTADAVDALERATRQEPQNAAAHNNLAAAYLARAARENRPDDLPRALEAAERAVRARPDLGEAWFNRALALEKLGRRDEAARAWADASERQQDDGWRTEARNRRNAP